MESKRAFIEAYISARHPTSRICGLALPAPYLMELYPYDAASEIDYLLDLFEVPTNRTLFERVVVPEVRALGERESQEDAVTRGETFSIRLVRAAMDRKLPAVVHWLTNFDAASDRCDLIHDGLGMMYELLAAMYYQPDLAFTMWFSDSVVSPGDGDNEAIRPVHALVEQYLLFLTEAARAKNHPAWQNKMRPAVVAPDMTAQGKPENV